jgi:serine/threonine-protein kinase
MLRRFGETTDPTIAERTTKACLLLPDAIEDLTPVMRLSERALAAQDHGYYPFFLLAAGLADFRSGEFARAVEELDEIVSRRQKSGYDPTNLQVPANLVLAMAHHRLGHKDEASEAFDRARNIMQRDDFLRVRSGDLGGFWHDWLICHILRREAEELLNVGVPFQTFGTAVRGAAETVPTVDKDKPLP